MSGRRSSEPDIVNECATFGTASSSTLPASKHDHRMGPGHDVTEEIEPDPVQPLGCRIMSRFLCRYVRGARLNNNHQCASNEGMRRC
jgi:hypothetical protein